jgi:hypothetical protein
MRRRVVLGLVGVCFGSFFAAASIAFAGESARVSKYLLELPDNLKTSQFENARAAVQQFGDESCSLVVTSRSCYAVTAAHCLRKGLDKQRLVDWKPIPADPTRRIGYVDPKKVNGR